MHAVQLFSFVDKKKKEVFVCPRIWRSPLCSLPPSLLPPLLLLHLLLISAPPPLV